MKRILRILILFSIMILFLSCEDSPNRPFSIYQDINKFYEMSDGLPAPRNVTVSRYYSYNEIRWDSVSKASYYYVYRSLYADGSSARRLGYTYYCDYKDYDINSYTTYYYYVTSYADGKESPKSVIVSSSSY